MRMLTDGHPMTGNTLSVDDIYTIVRRRICTVQYLPGQVVYENALATEFNISRTPIRSVLNRLVRDGLVTTKRGFGNTIAEIDYKSFQDAYRLRIKLAELMGDFASPSRIGEALGIYERLVEPARALDDIPNYFMIGEINLSIHEASMQLLRDTALSEAVGTLYLRTTRIWHLAIPHLVWKHEVEYVRAEIEQMVRALSLGDLTTAGYVRRNFIALAFKRIAAHPQLFDQEPPT
jgi:DNA-binding GntR family transcriptional regulator